MQGGEFLQDEGAQGVASEHERSGGDEAGQDLVQVVGELFDRQRCPASGGVAVRALVVAQDAQAQTGQVPGVQTPQVGGDGRAVHEDDRRVVATRAHRRIAVDGQGCAVRGGDGQHLSDRRRIGHGRELRKVDRWRGSRALREPGAEPAVGHRTALVAASGA